MDGVGNEVTQQIRSAIKGKLTELGAYVDDELPDYIMVMVANKKNKAQMVEDLNLFLGNSTEVFTTWLHEVLDRLQFVSVVKENPTEVTEEPTKNIITSSTQNTTNEVPKEVNNIIVNISHTAAEVKTTSMPRKLKRDKIKLVELEESEDFLALKDEPDIDDPLVEELKEEAAVTGITKSPPKTMTAKPIIKRQNIVAPIQKTILSMDETVEKLQRPINIRKRLTLTEIKPRLQRPFSTVGAIMKRPEQFVEEEEEEYDPHNPSVASVVCVSERKSSIHPSLQASTLLLQKAVEDAHKSVIGKRRRSPTRIEPYKPTPITQLFGRNRRELATGPTNVNHKEIVSQVPMAEIAQLNSDSDIDFDEKSLEEHDTRIVISCPEKQQEVKEHITGSSEDGIQEECEFVLKPSQISTVERPKLSGKRKADEANLLENNETSPHFVVTLDGVDPSHFIHKRAKRNVISNQAKPSTEQDRYDVEDLEVLSGDDVTQVEEVEESNMDVEDKRPDKIKERCRYWPACKNGDNCEYHHPRIPCKTFPNCKFADKCLYIHPNCKFDALCTRRECPFTHASKRALPSSLPFRNLSAPPMKPKLPGMRKICRFLPNCHNLQCVFFHPKPCRYGNQCQAPTCPFGHSSIPSPSQLKWIAPKL